MQTPAGEIEERVTLKKSAHWDVLPPSVRDALGRGVDRVRAIRAEILLSAAVAELPPVQIVDVGWEAYEASGESGAVLGLHTLVDVGDMKEFGVVLPAPVVIFGSDETIRGLLLHEFAHCFHGIRCVVESETHPERLQALRRQDPLNDELDRSRLDPPELWFSKRDVEIFPHHNSPLLTECTRSIQDQWKGNGLPMTTPVAVPSDRRLDAPASIIEHIRRNPSLVAPS